MFNLIHKFSLRASGYRIPNLAAAQNTSHRYYREIDFYPQMLFLALFGDDSAGSSGSSDSMTYTKTAPSSQPKQKRI